jgi:pimeloyl-ACP methyl ester carboxylesterase
MSEHPHVAYTGEFYAGLLTGFLRDVVTRPAIVVAHGRAANIAVRAASDAPALFERLVLVAPAVVADQQRDPTLSQTLMRTTQRLMLGIVPYAVLSTRPALRWIVTSRSTQAQDSGANAQTLDHLYASAHQFGGHHALLALLTGELDLPMRNAFALLEPPVLIVAGRQDRLHPRADLEDLAVVNPHADLRLIEGAGDAVFDDQPDGFVALLTQWLDAPASRHMLDETALLPPDQASAQQPESGLVGRVQSRVERADDAETQVPPMPTKGDVPPQATQAAGSHEGKPPTEDAMVGEPGAVVPGVSDMGLAGPNTSDVGGITTLEEPGVTLGPAAPLEPATAAESADAPAVILPEAGSTGAPSPAEEAARSAENPPLAPAANIGQPAQPAGGTDTADAVSAGDVAGLAQTIQTPNGGVETPTSEVHTSAESVTTADEAVHTPDQAVNPPASREGDASTGGQDVASRAGRQTQHATRAAAREPGARKQPSKAPGAPGAPGASGTAGAARKAGTSHSSHTPDTKRGKAAKSTSTKGTSSGTKHKSGGKAADTRRSSPKSKPGAR